MVCAARTADAKRLTEELMVAMRAGDQDARNRLIEVMLPRCTYFVSLAGAQASETDRVGAFGECQLALVGAVARIATKEQPVRDPYNYLLQVIRATAVKSLGTSSNMVAVPQRTYKKYKDADGGCGKPLWANEHFDEPCETGQHALLDTLEELEACCRNDKEFTVLRMFARGQTAEAIARAIGAASVSTVYSIREKIYALYVERQRT
jgi:hypothetical protein